MSSVDLIQPLLQGSGLLSQCATKSTMEKNARQLLSASLKFLDLARQIRLGQLKIPDADVEACAKEVADTIDAASRATSEGDYRAVVVEANEAIDVICLHAGPGAQLAIGRSLGPPSPWGTWGPWGTDPRVWDQRHWTGGGLGF